MIYTCERIGSIQLEEEIPLLEIGDIARIINKQHAWYNDIVIIRDKKHKQYRIEVHGRNIWVPEHWVGIDD